MCRIIANTLHNAQTFSLTLPEKDTIARREELGPLDEAERHEGAVAGSDEGAIDVDHCTSLADRSNVQHRLVFGLDGGCVRQDQN